MGENVYQVTMTETELVRFLDEIRGVAVGGSCSGECEKDKTPKAPRTPPANKTGGAKGKGKTTEKPVEKQEEKEPPEEVKTLNDIKEDILGAIKNALTDQKARGAYTTKYFRPVLVKEFKCAKLNAIPEDRITEAYNRLAEVLAANPPAKEQSDKKDDEDIV